MGSKSCNKLSIALSLASQPGKISIQHMLIAAEIVPVIITCLHSKYLVTVIFQLNQLLHSKWSNYNDMLSMTFILPPPLLIKPFAAACNLLLITPRDGTIVPWQSTNFL